MKKALILLFLSITICSFSQNAMQNKSTTTPQIKGDLQLQVEVLELKSKIDSLSKKENTDKDALGVAKISLDISKQYSEKADKLVDRYLLIQTVVISLVALLFAVAGLLGYFGLRRYIKTELLRILRQKEIILIDLFKKHEKERGLLDDSKILILNKKGTTIDKNFMMVLEKFNKPKTDDIVDINTHRFKYDFSDFDAVIFDNTDAKGKEENWDFNKNEDNIKDSLIKIANEVCSKKVAFIFFGKNDGRFSENITNNSYLINFSNSPATIFANLINLLEFRRLLNEKTI